ncbi:hypothetical protein AGMMS49975_20670 [Clostridia bacterium]|nr:hypothetical protein AGMMS49975_20670 [Clostridia bacterium]
MRKISSLDELNIPEQHRAFLETFMRNSKSDKKIGNVVLFGSCARGVATAKSDVDIAVLGENMTDDDYIRICDYLPEYRAKEYVECDMLTISYSDYNKFIDTVGYVQRHIEREGIDISGVV